MNEFIRFETFQYISFVLACSLFFYFVTQFIRWFVGRIIPKKISEQVRTRVIK